MTMTSQVPYTTHGRRSTISRVARRLPLVAAATLVPLVPTAPAFATDHVICVGSPAGACDQNAGSITAAITAANANSVDDTILLGPGTYSDGPYDLDGLAHALTLKGSGQGATFLTLPAAASADSYVMANHAMVRDLSVTMAAALSSNDVGIEVQHDSNVVAVTVDGAGTSNATGMVTITSGVSMSAIKMPTGTGDSGIFSLGAASVTDSTISGDAGFIHSGNEADVLSRVAITAATRGIETDGGTVTIDDAVIDLGSSAGIGLAALNYNAGIMPKAILANHVTIVGGGAGSKGAYAYAANPDALQVSAIQLDNSIVRGPATSLAVMAGNKGGLGGPSTATITARYSTWSTKSEIATANGTAEVVVGAGNIDIDPAFRDAAGGDYRLSTGSPVIDHGDPVAGGPSLDLDGNARVVDGDGDGTSVRDMGAFEVYAAAVHDSTAPDTAILTGPAGPTADSTPTFTFSSEAGAGFQCRVDAGAYAACSGLGSSHTTALLGDGAHTFFVRATDAASNTDATPASRSFTVDTLKPATKLTSKPAKFVTRRKVKFSFSSNETGATFSCRLDKRAWGPCISPKKLRVKVGEHRFFVRATDAAGNTDATPAKYRFTRTKRSN